MGAVPGRVERDESAAGDLPVHVGADLAGRQRVVRAFDDERGHETRDRSALLSERNVVRAKTSALAGSVRQKLSVSSSPSSGRSGVPMMLGAIACDQPR